MAHIILHSQFNPGVDTIKKYLKIYLHAIRVSISSAMAYRANFLLQIFINLLGNVVFPLVTLLIYATGASFQGWGMYEVLLIQSIYTLSSGLSGMFFNGIVYSTMDHVENGTLEVVLIKPVDSLLYLLASTFNLYDLGVVIGGGVIFGISVIHVGGISWFGWLAFFPLFLAGLLVMLGFQLLMAATSFKWVANYRIPEIYNSVTQFGKYPAGLFPKGVVTVISFIIPVAMIGFFPASALLGQLTAPMFLALLPCALFLSAGILVYRHMVRLYSGAGG